MTVLLVVGAASRKYIARHKRLGGYTSDDFELLSLLIGEFTEIILLPHILTEVSNLTRQIEEPARSRIQERLRFLIASCTEFPARSIDGAQRAEFGALGLTDATILHFCSLATDGLRPTLLTVDAALADRVSSLGYSVIEVKREFLSP